MTWGSRDEIDGWHVFYIEDENTPLNRTTHPTYQGKWWLIDAFPAHRLDFSSRLSLPRVFLVDCMEYELDFVITGTEPYTEAPELHAYWKMCDANYPGPRHHFLGHSVLWQDKVEREVVINSQGIETQQDPETKLYSYSKEQLERIESEINKWQFLFQIDSDFTTLGETGSIYICIPKTSLAARNFADCWTILQCT